LQTILNEGSVISSIGARKSGKSLMFKLPIFNLVLFLIVIG
jgi:hypothetical protein